MNICYLQWPTPLTTLQNSIVRIVALFVVIVFLLDLILLFFVLCCSFFGVLQSVLLQCNQRKSICHGKIFTHNRVERMTINKTKIKIKTTNYRQRNKKRANKERNTERREKKNNKKYTTQREKRICLLRA